MHSHNLWLLLVLCCLMPDDFTDQSLRETPWAVKGQGSIPLGWSGLGSGSVIQDHSDHSSSKELMNLWPEWNHWFLWCTMIWVILDHLGSLILIPTPHEGMFPKSHLLITLNNFFLNFFFIALGESSFNMTRGRNEDIERGGGSENF